MNDIEIHWTAGLTPDDAESKYHGFKEEILTLPKGHRSDAGRAAFQMATVMERDVAISMRDGVTLRADIFRPQQDEKVPVIIAWSPYGKNGTGFFSLDLTPGRAGVPLSRTSGYEKFQGPDPAEWTVRGYAICNIDSRGVFDSEGDIRWFGTDEGKDGYDAVEYLATLPWCNGSVTMTGNSWLTVTQWFTAAENPPHLKCIAPLEGASDTYRELAARGGPPALGFLSIIQGKLFGRTKREDLVAMIEKYPIWNDYWADKRAKMDKIKIPAYIVASYSSGIHSEGTLRGFEESQGPKWLRIHATQEWYDNYTKECTEELQAFFDRYCKNIDNGWENTPRVRASVLRFNEPALVNHKFPDWPIPQTERRVLNLSTSGNSLTLEAEQRPGPSQSYLSDVPAQQTGNDTEEIQFTYEFTEAVFVIGYPSATLYVSCAEHDDMDVYVQLRKKDRGGHLVEHLNIPPSALGMTEAEVPDINPLKYLGPQGILRASHRGLDPELSKPDHLVLAHRKIQKISPGTVTKLEIPIWPCGIAFEAGERLVLKISGHDMRLAEFTALAGAFKSGNKGSHVVYCGQDGYHSQLSIPIVKP